mmetsp:Transcript_21576/g.56035  ORF Transcript_21576/g.56035 Transcript_21576/m.56035 type:complete len:111 (-) Transcript_21576:359-691(-)
MEMSPAQLKSIHLYRSLLRVVAAWPETAGASFRIPLLRRIMQEFRKNKNETDPSKISQLQAAGEVQLSAARRLLDNAYKTKADRMMKAKPLRPSKTEEGQKGSWRRFLGF